MTIQNTSWELHDRAIRPYLWSHRIVGWLGSAVQLGILYLLLFADLGKYFASEAKLATNYPFLEWLIFFAALGGLMKVASFPFSFVHYQIDRKKNVSRQTVPSWLWDQVKGILVVSVIATVALYALYLITNSSHSLWWMEMAAFLIFFSVVLAQLAPVLLLPLFVKMKPLETTELRTRLLDLATRFKIKVDEVYHLGLGEKTEKGNAAFMGMGKTKRIVIGDTLYEKFPHDEVEAVFAHELGHQVHNDLWKGLFLSSTIMVVTLALSDFIFQRWVIDRIGVTQAAPFGFFCFMTLWSVTQTPFQWVQTFYSRQREWAADQFASEKVGLGKPLGLALERLTYQNRALFKPNAIIEFFTYSHPAPWRRISKLKTI
jgi:STE24 endopeptidase